jgi:uncharacterized protein (TIGR00369 family)
MNPPAAPAVTAEEIETVLSGSPFVQPYGLKLEAFADGSCALRLPFGDRHQRPGGVVTGIVLVAAADLAMWFAIMTRLGRAAGDRSVTIELKSSFLRGARGDIVTTARWLGEADHAIHGVADARDPEGTLVAHHVLTYVDPR